MKRLPAMMPGKMGSVKEEFCHFCENLDASNKGFLVCGVS